MNFPLNQSNDSNQIAADLRPQIRHNHINLIWQVPVCVIPSVANVLLFVVFIIRIKKERTYSNVLFFLLNISDVIVGLIAIISELLAEVKAMLELLRLIIWVVSLAQTSISLFITFFLTIHRYNLLTSPLKTTEKLSNVRIALNVVNWLMGYLLWVVFFGVHAALNLAVRETPGMQRSPVYLYTLTCILAFASPILGIIVFTSLTIFGLHKISSAKKSKTRSASVNRKDISTIFSIFKSHKSNYQINQNDSTSESNRSNVISTESATNRRRITGKTSFKKETKAITCLFLIVFICLFSQIFYLIIIPLYDLNVYFNNTLFRLSIWFTYLKSFVDPFILLLFHEPVKNEIKKLLESIKKKLC